MFIVDFDSIIIREIPVRVFALFYALQVFQILFARGSLIGGQILPAQHLLNLGFESVDVHYWLKILGIQMRYASRHPVIESLSGSPCKIFFKKSGKQRFG